MEKIIGLQNVDGSWTEKGLIKEVCLDTTKAEALMKQVRVEIVITYLMMSWMKKYHPEKQYALLVKKAQSWLKKALQETMMEEGKLQELEGCI